MILRQHISLNVLHSILIFTIIIQETGITLEHHLLDQLLGPCLFSYTLATFTITFLTTYKLLELPYTPLKPTAKNIYSHLKYNKQPSIFRVHSLSFYPHLLQSHTIPSFLFFFFFFLSGVFVFCLSCFLLFFMHFLGSVFYCSKRIMFLYFLLCFQLFLLLSFSV